MFVRGVRGAIDIFRTALPNPAVEEGSANAAAVRPFPDESAPEHRFPEHLLEYSSRVCFYIYFWLLLFYIY